MTTTAPAKAPKAAASKSAAKPAVANPAAPVVAPTNAAFAEFQKIAEALAVADLQVQTASGESKQAAAARASLATDALKAAIKSKAHPDTIRTVLLEAQVLKGTVSKIVTVVVAVEAGTIALSDFKSLSEAYGKVNLTNRVAKVTAYNTAAAKAGKPLKVVPGTSAAAPPLPVIKEVEKVVMPQPKDALEVILKDIREAGDDDMILDRASYWVTELTTKITKITSKVGASED